MRDKIVEKNIVVKSLRQEKAELQKKIESTTVKAPSQDISKLQAEIKVLKRSQSILQNTVDHKNHTIAQLEISNSSNHDSVHKVIKLETKLKENQAKRKALENELNDYIECLDDAESENKQLRQQLQDYAEQAIRFSESQTAPLSTELESRSDESATEFLKLALRLFQIVLLIHTFSDFGLLFKILLGESSGIDWGKAVFVTQDMVSSVSNVVETEETYQNLTATPQKEKTVAIQPKTVQILRAPKVKAQNIEKLPTTSKDSSSSTQLKRYQEVNWQLKRQNDYLKLRIYELADISFVQEELANVQRGIVKLTTPDQF